MNQGGRKPRRLERLPKTLGEIHRIARERNPQQVPLLTCRDLEVLYFELNRSRYKLEEQDDFIRFFLVVHEALQECRRMAKGEHRK